MAMLAGVFVVDSAVVRVPLCRIGIFLHLGATRTRATRRTARAAAQAEHPFSFVVYRTQQPPGSSSAKPLRNSEPDIDRDIGQEQK